MWGKRATKEMAEPSFMEDSLVGKPFAFTDLACFYPWCQVGVINFYAYICFFSAKLIFPSDLADKMKKNMREPFLIHDWQL